MSSPNKQPATDHVQRLVRQYFRAQHGELLCGEIPISELAAQYGTPLYVYDRRTLDAKWEQLRAALPPQFDIFYSIKANPSRQLLQFFLDKGCGLEIASGGELYQALQAGGAPRNIVFAGPGKTDEELRCALENDIGEIHVESLNEATRLERIAKQTDRTARVALRVNPTSDAQGGAMRMGGKPAPFGVDEEQLDDTLQQLRRLPQLKLQGIHLFSGTQILDADVLIHQYRKAISIARRVVAQTGQPLKTIDFGGGLGVAYFGHETDLDLIRVAAGLPAVLEELRKEPLLADCRLIVEPGRFLVAEAGLYVARVTDIKASRGKKFLITDGGMHHHLAASGNLGQTIKRNYPIAVVNKVDVPGTEAVDVVGPLCTPLDVLARSVSLPRAEVGDLIGVFQSGAYARSASPLGFLSHRSPPEVLVDGDQHWLIRRRGSQDSLLADQLPGRAIDTAQPAAGVEKR